MKTTALVMLAILIAPGVAAAAPTPQVHKSQSEFIACNALPPGLAEACMALAAAIFIGCADKPTKWGRFACRTAAIAG